MSNNNYNYNNYQFVNFNPYSGYGGQFPLQNPHYLLNIREMYLSQYPGIAVYFNPYRYYYQQQQQYRQMQIPPQQYYQQEITSQRSQVPLVFHNSIQPQSEQQFGESAWRQDNFQNTQAQTEQNNQNNGSDPSGINRILQGQPNATEDNLTAVKQEEGQSPNKRATQMLGGNRQSQDNNFDNFNEDPHKKKKIEDDQNNKISQLKKELEIMKKGQNNQDSQQIQLLEKKIKLEELIQLIQLNQQIKEEDDDYEDVEEEEQVCQDEPADQNCNQSANIEKNVSHDFSKQREEIQPSKQGGNDSQRIVEQINQQKSTLDIRNSNQNNLVVNEKKERKHKAKNTNKKSQSPKSSATSKNRIKEQREKQAREAEEEIQEIQIFYDSQSQENKTLIKQLIKIKVQNLFKNIITGLRKTVNESFQTIYVYDVPQEYALTGKNHSTLEVTSIKQPSQEQKDKFYQKFNKYFTEKQLNNRSINQVVKNKLYSKILSVFIDDYSEEWLQASALSNKEDNRVFLNFLKLAIQEHRYLLFLQRSQVLKLIDKQQ